MATYVEILKNEFPEIDSEVFDYITGESWAPELIRNSVAVRWNITHCGLISISVPEFVIASELMG